MHRITLLVNLLVIFYFSPARGQKINHAWAFGHYMGLDFSSGGPTFFRDSMQASEGCASVCDSSGKLLFYSNGNKVYDRSHRLMPNGSGIMGHKLQSSTQGVGILPIIRPDSFFYLFTLDEYGAAGDFRYSKIDMWRNGGWGDVDPMVKNVLIGTNRSEKLNFARNCDQFWILTHHKDSAIFYVQNIDISSGRISSPVSFAVGKNRDSNMYHIGELKISPDQRTLALANYSVNGNVSTVELYDFDPVTGTVSHYRLLDSIRVAASITSFYAIEFSADGSKLYSGGSLGLFQFDLSLGSLSAIQASKTKVSDRPTWGMRKGPDNMIYLIENTYTPQNFSRVRQPNLSGTLCDIEYNFLSSSFHNPYITLGFGLQVPSMSGFISDTIIRNLTYNTCHHQTISASDKPKRVWYDGDTASEKTFFSTGTYWLFWEKDCILRIDTLHINILPATYSSKSENAMVCDGLTLMLQASRSSGSYLWNTGATTPDIRIGAPGTYWVYNTKDCHVHTDSFHVSGHPTEHFYDVLDTLICFLDSIRLNAPSGLDSLVWSGGNHGQDTVLYRPDSIFLRGWQLSDCRIIEQGYKVDFVQIQNPLRDTFSCNGNSVLLHVPVNKPGSLIYWSTGDTGTQIQVKETGIYRVEVVYRHCRYFDSIRLTQRFLDTDLGKDSIACYGHKVLLNAGIKDALYRWNTGDTTKDIGVQATGLYRVYVEKEGCSCTDSVYIGFRRCTDCTLVPNAFSPNGDQRNDRFRPIIHCPVAEYTLRIFSRWGEELFSTNDPGQGWDGLYLGRKQELGTYFYLIKIKYADQGDSEQFQGDVHLLY